MWSPRVAFVVGTLGVALAACAADGTTEDVVTDRTFEGVAEQAPEPSETAPPTTTPPLEGTPTTTRETVDSELEDFPDWYPDEVVARHAQSTAAERRQLAEIMELFRPRASGPLGREEAASRALMLALDETSDASKATVVETTWEASSRLLLDEGPSADARLGLASDVMVVVVEAEIVNTDVPEGAKAEVYDRYTVMFEPQSAAGFLVCYGCPEKAEDLAALLAEEGS